MSHAEMVSSSQKLEFIGARDTIEATSNNTGPHQNISAR